MALALAYIGLEVADESAFAAFAEGGLGLMPRPGPAHLYRLDRRAWRIAVQSGSRDDIAYAGFEFSDVAALARLADMLPCAQELTFDELAIREVESGFWISDPDGLRLEFVTGHADVPAAFASQHVSSFVTDDQGLGHIVLGVSDLAASEAFYAKLGFAVSDYITMPIGPAMLRVAFMNCGPRHHTVAIAALPPGKRLNHFMIEAASVDDVIKGHRRCTEQGRAPGNLGRHPNDRMLSFYVPSPAGFDVELGYDGLRIDGEWSVVEYEQMSLWGHERAGR
jgi:2,3-dihydroxybiphenyl 1,2-dioxygenase